jgi:hypothetical protein
MNLPDMSHAEGIEYFSIPGQYYLPAFIRELSMCLWLLIKGAKLQQAQ